MIILLWLVPPAVVTVVAMVWVGWLGREGRGAVDRDEALARLGKALDAEPSRRRRRPGYAATEPERDRSSGLAVRVSQPALEPVVEPVVEPGPKPVRPRGTNTSDTDTPPGERYAS